MLRALGVELLCVLALLGKLPSNLHSMSWSLLSPLGHTTQLLQPGEDVYLGSHFMVSWLQRKSNTVQDCGGGKAALVLANREQSEGRRRGEIETLPGHTHRAAASSQTPVVNSKSAVNPHDSLVFR